mmetsp:Transcript_56405/g.181083  ORF Transcript_56405/g.181083 Transcript_56405/m.181083 type:complete len:343 (+) Transcript_56405:1163-2191(+)
MHDHVEPSRSWGGESPERANRPGAIPEQGPSLAHHRPRLHELRLRRRAPLRDAPGLRRHCASPPPGAAGQVLHPGRVVFRVAPVQVCHARLCCRRPGLEAGCGGAEPCRGGVACSGGVRGAVGAGLPPVRRPAPARRGEGLRAEAALHGRARRAADALGAEEPRPAGAVPLRSAAAAGRPGRHAAAADARRVRRRAARRGLRAPARAEQPPAEAAGPVPLPPGSQHPGSRLGCHRGTRSRRNVPYPRLVRRTRRGRPAARGREPQPRAVDEGQVGGKARTVRFAARTCTRARSAGNILRCKAAPSPATTPYRVHPRNAAMYRLVQCGRSCTDPRPTCARSKG